MILDSCFVIALEREAKRKIQGPALNFLSQHPSESFQITFTVSGELACGDSMAQKAEWKRLLQPFHVLPWSIEISWRYGESFRALKQKGKLIGTNDLWIASTALAHDETLVTNNLSEFSRIPGLKILTF
ncbi:MAG: type II toxin-antitoxin system VapC family toxin [Verrucomicrobia bacterium]|nr:type II toxin-antitoxin system VapC family toxin [Verrucomicrobiota bacterium]MCH8510104.1 type II toxin-antitoxin system VapC family toxin [Kiritimatiellia bacterium]